MPIRPFRVSPKVLKNNFVKAADKLHEWLEKTNPKYLASTEYMALSKANKKYKGQLFQLLMELHLHSFTGSLVDIDVDTVRIITEDLIPHNAVCSAAMAKAMIPELIAYWTFLRRECGDTKLKHAVDIVSYLESIKEHYPAIYRRSDEEDFGLTLYDKYDPDNPDAVPWVEAMFDDLLDDNQDDGVQIVSPWTEILAQPGNILEVVQHICLNPFEHCDTHLAEAIEAVVVYGFQIIFTQVRNKNQEAEGVLQLMEALILEADNNTGLVPQAARVLFRALVPFRMYLSKEFILFVQQWLVDDNRKLGADGTPPPSAEHLKAIFIELIEEAPDEFAAMQALQPMLGITPLDTLATIFHILAETNDVRLGNVLALYVLDADEEVALAAIETLNHYPYCVGPVSLNRFIRIRNWLPGKVKSALDILVRNLRKRGVIPKDAVTAAQVTGVWMPPVDGVGSQGVMVQLKEGDMYRLAGCVFKEGIGIVDALWTPPVMKRDTQAPLDMMRTAMGHLETVSPDIIVALIPEFLTLHVNSGLHLDFELVMLMELLGMKSWNPQKQNFEQLLPAQLLVEPGAREIAEVQKSSLRWCTTPLGQRWFELDDQLETILEGVPDKHLEVAICDKLLENKRSIWQERLLRLALWAHHAVTNRPSQKFNTLAREFMVVRHLLGTPIPARDIGLLRGVARLTVKTMLEPDDTLMFGY